MRTPYYITTPIYYANAKIHFGNLYTSIIADTIARSKRLLGYDVIFATGTDENGQKMVQVAQKEGKSVMEFLDEIVAQDREVMDISRISYTDFIRTSEARHHKFVQKVLQKTYEAGAIYEGTYEGMYCIGCESFKKETDLIDHDGHKVCPDHLKVPEMISEKNYFFRLSDYENKLKEFYQNHPHFIQPQYRYNEILAFVEGGLEDFSISRQHSTVGIPLPFDPENVTYIWYDALLNYLTVVVDHYDENWDPVFKPHAQKMNHTLGKDIARFHAIYRPAMMMAAGYEHLIPQQEFVGGFFTVDGQKMSKSLGNTLYAEDLIAQYNRDAMVFYLLYDIPQGADWDFSLKRLQDVYESMLMGSWWNLVSRVSKLADKLGITQAQKHYDTITLNLNSLEEAIDQAKIQHYLQQRYDHVQQANLLMQREEPRVKLKDPSTYDDAVRVLEHLLWEIKQLSLLAAPFLIESFDAVKIILGNQELQKLNSDVILEDKDTVHNLFAQESFSIQLAPNVVYQKKTP